MTINNNTINLKPMFKNLVEITNKPVFKTEWNDKDQIRVNNALRKVFLHKTLIDHNNNNKYMYTLKDVEYFFGLPYTSSSSFAMIGNTNTLYYVDIENQFNIEFFAITEDNKVILSAWDNEENERYFII